MRLSFDTLQLMTDCLSPQVTDLSEIENRALHRLLADLDVVANISELPVGVRHNESSESRIVFTIGLELDLIARVDHIVKKNAIKTAWELSDRLLIVGFERGK